jgi:hypothetical protein
VMGVDFLLARAGAVGGGGAISAAPLRRVTACDGFELWEVTPAPGTVTGAREIGTGSAERPCACRARGELP